MKKIKVKKLKEGDIFHLKGFSFSSDENLNHFSGIHIVKEVYKDYELFTVRVIGDEYISFPKKGNVYILGNNKNLNNA